MPNHDLPDMSPVHFEDNMAFKYSRLFKLVCIGIGMLRALNRHDLADMLQTEFYKVTKV